MKFNFEGTTAAAEGGMTPPGTIAVFKIEEIKFETKPATGGGEEKELFEVTFARKEDSFREFFYLTPKAAERFVYLYSKVMGTETMPESEAGIISALKGKEIALKVSGNVNPGTGKGYPSLPYSGFAKPVAELAELKFSNTEQGKVNETIAAQLNSSAAATPTANGAAIAAPAGDDSF